MKRKPTKIINLSPISLKWTKGGPKLTKWTKVDLIGLN